MNHLILILSKNKCQKKSISVIGAGSWGTALSMHLARIGHKVNLWVYEKLLCEQIKETKENPIFLPGFNLPNLILSHKLT